MFEWMGVSKKWVPLKLENCTYECPLYKYKKIVNPYLPKGKSQSCTCSKTPSKDSEIYKKHIKPEYVGFYALLGDDLFSYKYASESIAY